jgi:predicted small lipoprotein YifL
MDRKILLTVTFGALLALAACEQKGPMEKAGEKVDETVRTLKNGGEKTPSDKVKDAAQDVRSSAEKAVDDIKK